VSGVASVSGAGSPTGSGTSASPCGSEELGEGSVTTRAESMNLDDLSAGPTPLGTEEEDEEGSEPDELKIPVVMVICGRIS
jgi:hypothetical protein